MGPIETLVAGIFALLFMLIGIFWVSSDERPSKYSTRHQNDRWSPQDSNSSSDSVGELRGPTSVPLLRKRRGG